MSSQQSVELLNEMQYSEIVRRAVLPRAFPMEHLFMRQMPCWKRSCDIVGAGLLLLLLSPIFAALAAYIKIVSRGPVFFAQERIGYRGLPFKMWKFRSMWHNVDHSVHCDHLKKLIRCGATDKPMAKIEDDSRIIPHGWILRSLCLDELPQLYNVLIGDMSLVGPRPAVHYEVEEYSCWHKSRFDCVPGMTGLWQVSGKNNLSFRQMVTLDIRYSRQISPWQDLKILAKTAPAVLGQFKRRNRKSISMN